MEDVNTFLKSSTIHGLQYIGSTKSTFVRLFRITAVSISFTISLIMIFNSFSAWEESPVISTTKLKPISMAKFPKVTVCPPKDSNTVLNYDISSAVNMSLKSRFRSNLVDSAKPFLLKEYYEVFLQHQNAYLNMQQINDLYYGKARYVHSPHKYKYESISEYTMVSKEVCRRYL